LAAGPLVGQISIQSTIIMYRPLWRKNLNFFFFFKSTALHCHPLAFVWCCGYAHVTCCADALGLSARLGAWVCVCFSLLNIHHNLGD
jgi:hypothetical protein